MIHKPSCEAVRDCPLRAFVQISIGGTHADKREPTNVCRRHTTSLIADFQAVSNDIRVRGAV